MKYVVLVALFALDAFAQPTIGGCPSFPPNNIWNTPVDMLATDSQSAMFIAKIGPTAPLRLDDVMPINIVSEVDPRVRVSGIAAPESDSGAYVIPANPQIEPGTDNHLIVVDRTSCVLYELYGARRSGGAWTASNGAKWDLNSNALRPDGWTSADAAGLPIMPGVLRYEEVASGMLNHALRFTSPYTRGNGVYRWPARHYASHNPDGPPMGLRLRLKASIDISGYSPNVQVILRALKRYGAILADNGMPWGMQHDSDPRWNAAELVTLHRVLGSNMEAIDVSGLMGTRDSGLAGPAPGLIFGTDALGRPNLLKLGPGLGIVNGLLTISR